MDLADADARSTPAGLDEDGVLERRDLLAHLGGAVAPVVVGYHDVGQDRETGRLEHELHVVLVHADSGGEHARSRRSARRRSRAGPGWCRPRPTGRAARGRRRRRRRESPARGRTRGPRSWPSCRTASDSPRCPRRRPRGGRRAGDGQPFRIARLEHPGAVGSDPDRDDVVLVAVDRGRTLPAVTQEIACSLERPPKRTTTRGRALGGRSLMMVRPYLPRALSLGHAPRASASPVDPGGEGRSPPGHPGQPPQRAADDGLDVRRGR